MAKTININPNNDTIGATVMRLVLKTSGLNSTPDEDPDMRINPKTTIRNPTAIRITFSLPSVKRGEVSIFLLYKMCISNSFLSL